MNGLAKEFTRLFTLAGWFAALYVLGAFVCADFNPAHWTTGVRVMITILGMYGAYSAYGGDL